MSFFNNRNYGQSNCPYNFGYKCPACKPLLIGGNNTGKSSYSLQNSCQEQSSCNPCSNKQEDPCSAQQKSCGCPCDNIDPCTCQEKEECECICENNSYSCEPQCTSPCSNYCPFPPPAPPAPPIPPVPGPVIFSFTKIDAITNEVLSGAIFELADVKGNVQTYISDIQGNVTFTIEKGLLHILTETSAPLGYRHDPTQYTVIADPYGRIRVDGIYIDDLRIENQAIGVVGFSFIKYNSATGLPLSGSTFELLRDGASILSAMSDNNGIVLFENLLPGTYTLEETIPTQGFQRNQTIYEVVVYNDGRIEIENQPVSLFSISNEPQPAATHVVTYLANHTELGTSLPTQPIEEGLSYTIEEGNILFITTNEFLYWNTQPDGNGRTYYPGKSMPITENLTLYAIWKSNIPFLNNMYVGAIEVTGYGITGSEITVIFPSGAQVSTIVEGDSSWRIPVPSSDTPLTGNMDLVTTQTQTNMVVSEQIQTTVLTHNT